MSDLQAFPAWQWQVPEYLNIGVACTDNHLETPIANTTAMIVEDDLLGTSQISFADLSKRTHQFAQLLRDQGIDAGQRVLIRLPNCLDYPIAFLGAMKRGAISVPTSTLLTVEEVLYLAQDSAAQVLVIDNTMWPQLREHISQCADLRLVL
ncbi:MAG: AMP-binding protein, partial [Methylophaga sp.]|nr:AMP-binding protein [Methylophaga sp.]